MPQKQANSAWIAGAEGQTLIFNNYFNRLQLLALSAYEWTGLPASCNERFLEKCLRQDGRACIINDDEMGYINLRVNPNGEMNMYENFTGYECYSIGINKLRSANECVYIRNNWLESPTLPILTFYARKLTDIERTIIINIHAQSTPILVRTTRETELTLKNLYMKYDGFMPAIYIDRDLDENSISVLKTDAPYLADRLQQEKLNTWHEALTYIGIASNMDFKRAQMQSEEVEQTAEHYGFMAESGLISRQDACDQAKRLFSLDISVKRRSITSLQEVMNGGIYNASENIN